MAADRTRPLAELVEILGHDFSDMSLLAQAVTHSSAAVGATDSYERLEFLGDRVLALVMAEKLLAAFPGEAEGDIARRHVALVRRETATSVAVAIGLGQFLRLSKGEAEANVRENTSILADALEAVLAALYLDGGLAAARAFLEAHWEQRIAGMDRPPRDAKTTLQEWAQARGLPLPRYAETARSVPPHAPEFAVEVEVQGHGRAAARGSSKRRAEQACAAMMLAKLGAVDG